MNINRIQGLAVAALLVAPYFVTAQSVQEDLRRTLKLKQYLTIEELTDGYMAIKIGDESQLGMIAPFMYLDMMDGPGTVTEQVEKMRYMGALWTKGDVIEIGGTGYLVTYQTDTFEIMMKMDGDYQGSQGIALHLDLVNLDNIKTIRPIADLTPQKYADLFGDMFAGGASVSEGLVGDAAQIAALSNIKQISTAMIIYAADYEDLTPYAQSTKTVEYVTLPYLRSLDLWKTLNPNGSRFLFNMAVAGVNIDDLNYPPDVVMFYESRAWPDGRRLVSFMDSTARLLTEKEWQEVKGSMKLKLKKSAVPLPADYGVTIGMWGEPIPPSG